MIGSLPLTDATQPQPSEIINRPGKSFTLSRPDLLKQAQQTVSQPPEYGTVTTTEAPAYSDWTEADIARFMKELEAKGNLPKQSEEAIPNKSIINSSKEVQEHKTWLQKILDWFRNLFR